MRGLFRYLSPFASDQSGAASVLYGLGGMVVILAPADAPATSAASTSPAGSPSRPPSTPPVCGTWTPFWAGTTAPWKK